MDPRFQSSFIPKKPVMTSMRPARGPINLLSLISTIVFIIALALGGGVFLYQSYLNNSIASDTQSLNLTKSQFDPATINDIIRLDSRLNTANSLLSQHAELSNLFLVLENTTLQTVRFTNFNFTIGDKNTLTLSMNGEALGFADVALQAAAFNKSPYFKNLIVTGLSLESSGGVAFMISVNVDPSLISYAAPAAGSVSPIIPTTTSSLSAPTVATSSPAVPVAPVATSSNSTNK